jgi:hypothetical protein
MPLRRCKRCNRYHRSGARCPLTRGPNGAWSPRRDRQAQRELRDILLERAGHRCEYLDAAGVRCEQTHDLRAAHRTPLRDRNAYDAVDALLLCAEHDRQLDPFAR